MKYFYIAIMFGMVITACSDTDSSLDVQNQFTADEQSAADNQNPDTAIDEQISSTGSFIPEPLGDTFFTDTTVMVELLIYRKSIDGPSMLLEQTQLNVPDIGEDIELALTSISREATVPLGTVASDGVTLLEEFRSCEGELEPQDFNLIARSTDSSGEFVSIVNTDFCGSVPNFTFADINGEIGVGVFGSLLFLLENPLYQELIQF